MKRRLESFAVLLAPFHWVPVLVEQRRWRLVLATLALVAGISGGLVGARTNTKESHIAALEKLGTLAKTSERDLLEGIEQAHRQAIIFGAAKGAFLTPLTVLGLAILLSFVSWVFRARITWSGALTVATVAATPMLLYFIIRAFLAWTRPPISQVDLGAIVPSALRLVGEGPLSRAAKGIELFRMWSAFLIGLGWSAQTKWSMKKSLLFIAALYVAYVGFAYIGLDAPKARRAAPMNFAIVAVLLVQAPRVELTLEQVRSESRRQLDAVRALLDYERAGAGVTVARSSIFPQLNLSLGAGAYYAGDQRQFSTIPVTDSKGTITGYESAAVDTPGFSRANFNLSVTVSQLLYDGGRWWNRIFLAGRQQDAAKGQLQEQQLASELEAVRRFYVLLDAQYAYEVLQSAVGRSEAQLERAKGLYDAGRSPKSEVFDAMTNLANDKVAVIRQRQTIDEARLSLLQWLSREDTPVVAVVPPERTSLPPEIDATLQFARENRPLLASLQQSLKASEYAQKVAFAPFLPSLSFSATYQRTAPTVNPFFTDITKQNAVQFGGVLNWDLFNGLQHKGLYDQAKIERRRSEAALAQAVVDLQAEVRRTYSSLLTERDVLEIISANLRLAEEQLALEEGRYSIGKGTMLEVRNAQTKLTQTQLALVRSRASVAIAYASLERSVGGKLP